MGAMECHLAPVCLSLFLILPSDIMEELKTTRTTKAQSWHTQSGMHHLALKKEKAFGSWRKGGRSKEADATVREEGARPGLGGAPGAATFNLCLTTAHDEACFYTEPQDTQDMCTRAHTHSDLYTHSSNKVS